MCSFEGGRGTCNLGFWSILWLQILGKNNATIVRAVV